MSMNPNNLSPSCALRLASINWLFFLNCFPKRKSSVIRAFMTWRSKWPVPACHKAAKTCRRPRLFPKLIRRSSKYSKRSKRCWSVCWNMSAASSAGNKRPYMLVKARDPSRAFCVENRLVLFAAEPKRIITPLVLSRC